MSDVILFGCLIDLIMIPIRVGIEIIKWIAKSFGREIIMLGLAVISYLLWITEVAGSSFPSYASVFSMETQLFAKFGINIGVELGMFNLGWVFILYLCIVLLSPISQWTIAATYGAVASMVSMSVLGVFTTGLSLDSGLFKFLVLVISFVITILFMRMGFHCTHGWCSLKYEKLGLILGIVPAFFITYVTLSNLLTMTFKEAVIDKFGFVVLAIILDIVMFGAGIFLYFKFNKKYLYIMLKKLGASQDDLAALESDVVVKHKVKQTRKVSEPTQTVASEQMDPEAEDEKKDVSLSDDIVATLRKKNMKK